MDATDRLCRMLEERGVEYETDVLPNGKCGVSWIDCNDIEWEVVQQGENFEIHALQLVTPEQSIAATVGNRDTMVLWPEWEEVLFANVSDEVAQDNLNECVHELLDKAATVGAGTCIYTPDETGFTWWDENDVEHYEEHSASDECYSAFCDKCGNQMMVGDDGWFNGWDEITEWWEEDGSYHKGYVLEPRFKYCPNCGRKVMGE